MLQTIQILGRLRGNVYRFSYDTRSEKYQCQQFVHLPSHLITRRVVAKRNTEKQQPEIRSELTLRKIFGTKCDLALRRFNLYRCAPSREPSSISPTLANDKVYDDVWDERLIIIDVGDGHLPRKLSSIIF